MGSAGTSKEFLGNFSESLEVKVAKNGAPSVQDPGRTPLTSIGTSMDSPTTSRDHAGISISAIPSSSSEARPKVGHLRLPERSENNTNSAKEASRALADEYRTCSDIKGTEASRESVLRSQDTSPFIAPAYTDDQKNLPTKLPFRFNLTPNNQTRSHPPFGGPRSSSSRSGSDVFASSSSPPLDGDIQVAPIPVSFESTFGAYAGVPESLSKRTDISTRKIIPLSRRSRRSRSNYNINRESQPFGTVL